MPLKNEMDFSEALILIKQGKKVFREGWNGKGLSVEAQFPDAHSKMTFPYLFLNYANGNKVPWAPSQTDVMSGDWSLIE